MMRKLLKEKREKELVVEDLKEEKEVEEEVFLKTQIKKLKMTLLKNKSYDYY
jgi:hypothetical protein